MNLRTLLGWSLAATLLAACSGGGGGGSVSPSNGSSANNGDAITQGVSMRISAPIDLGPTSTNRRAPDFIGTNVTAIGYTFSGGAGGPISGTFSSTSPGVFTGCSSNAPATPVVQTCNVGLAPGTYTVAITLKQGANTIGTGSSGSVSVSSGAIAAFTVDVNPVNFAPALSIPGTTKQFYNDGTALQTIDLAENETDQAGDIITTYYGPVSNYPSLVLTATAGTTANVTLPGGTLGVTTAPTISTAPTLQPGYTTEPLKFAASGGAGTVSLALQLSDGSTTSSITVPFVSLANNGNITFSGIGSGNPQSFIVTESTTASSGGLDTTFNSSSNCGAHANFTPTLGANTVVPSGSTVSQSYSAYAVDTGTSTCTVTVTSAEDPSLTTSIVLNFPGTGAIGVNSHSRI
jgi:hypothetical protein